jgi:hypothetical protein
LKWPHRVGRFCTLDRRRNVSVALRRYLGFNWRIEFLPGHVWGGLLRDECSGLRLRQRAAAVYAGADRREQKQRGACRNASEHVDAPNSGVRRL